MKEEKILYHLLLGTHVGCYENPIVERADNRRNAKASPGAWFI